MATNNLYSIYDRKAQYHIMPLMCGRSDTDAVRMFTEVVHQSGTPISQYPADFDLLRIGSVELETGVLTPEHPSYPVVNGLVALTDAQRLASRMRSVVSTIDEEEPLPA